MLSSISFFKRALLVGGSVAAAVNLQKISQKNHNDNITRTILIKNEDDNTFDTYYLSNTEHQMISNVLKTSKKSNIITNIQRIEISPYHPEHVILYSKTEQNNLIARPYFFSTGSLLNCHNNLGPIFHNIFNSDPCNMMTIQIKKPLFKEEGDVDLLEFSNQHQIDPKQIIRTECLDNENTEYYVATTCEIPLTAEKLYPFTNDDNVDETRPRF